MKMIDKNDDSDNNDDDDDDYKSYEFKKNTISQLYKRTDIMLVYRHHSR